MGGEQSSMKRKAKRRNATQSKETSRNEKVLILGCGRSGKSTLCKQLMVIYGDLSSEEKRKIFTSVIINRDVIRAIKAILRAIKELEIPFEDPERVEDAREIEHFLQKYEYSDTIEMSDGVEKAWNQLLNDSGVQECVARSKYDLQDSDIYFLNNFQRIRQPDYIPSVEDMVRCYWMTTCVNDFDYKFKHKDTDFTLVDVGGNRPDRRKWILFFEDMTAVLYLVDISSYDKVLEEDGETNRLEESLKLWRSVCNNPWFAQTPFALVFNKHDAFEEKIAQRPLGDHFGEYDGDNTASDAFEYIKSLFFAISKESSRERETPMYLTCVTDTEDVRSFFEAFCDDIKKTKDDIEETHTCFWPHASPQPDSTLSKVSPESVETTYSQLSCEKVLQTERNIGSIKEKFDYPGWKCNIPKEILKEEKEVTISGRVGVDQKKDMPDITPTIECNPPVTFERPVSMTMRTSISAPAGKEIQAILLTRDHPGEEWKEMKKLSLGPINEVEFEIQHFGAIKVAAKSSDVKMLHSINGFYINVDTGLTAVAFSKDQAVYDTVEKSMYKSGFVNFSLVPHVILAKFGSEISVSMEQKKPEDITISEAFPSPTFTFDEEYLLKGKQIVYFELDPEPSDQCRIIRMQYGYKINGESERHLPLKIKRPPKETKTEIDSDCNITQYYNCSIYPTANQVAIGGGTITENLTGDFSTVVNAPVGQLAAANANITNQGSGINYVAGSQENTDRSVTAGKAIYGQSTSSSVGENITVSRT